MKLRGYYITILLLFFALGAMGKNTHILENPINVELEWNSLVKLVVATLLFSLCCYVQEEKIDIDTVQVFFELEISN